MALSPNDFFKRPLFLLLLVWSTGVLFWDSPKPHPDRLPRQTHQGTILENPRCKNDVCRILIALHKPSTNILLSVLGNVDSLSRGDVIAFTSSLKSPRSHKNPGVFDYAQFLSRKGISLTGFIDDATKIRQVIRHNSHVRALKEKASQLIEKSGTPQTQSLLRAILWGDERSLPETLWDLFRDFGLAHLLVISGLHFLALGAAAYGLIILFGKLYPKIFLWPFYRSLAALVSLAILTAYVLFCEPGPSIMRAYLSSIFLWGAFLMRRRRDPVSSLSLVALVMLIAKPFLIFDLGFQLSFASVIALWLVHPRIHELVKPQNLVMRFLWMAITLNMSLFIVIAPLIARHFHEIQVSGLLFNLLVVPYMEWLITPLGLIALALTPFWTAGATALYGLALIFLGWLIHFLEWSRNFFPGSLSVYPPHTWELILLYILVGVLVLKVTRRALWITLIALIFISDTTYWIYYHHHIPRLTLTHLDVGQGDAFLVEIPPKTRLLIDGGGSPYFDMGKQVLIPFLREARILNLDAIVITHADIDHYGGLKSVIEEFNVSAVWWNGVEHAEQESYKALLQSIRDKNIPLVQLKRHQELKELGLEVLASGLDPCRDNDNNESLVLKITHPPHSLLLTGDIMKDCADILSFDPKIQSTYLKIPHHGSRNSHSTSFLQMAKPLLATVSAGVMNSYRHPHTQVTQSYANEGIPLMRTDKNGAIRMEFFEDKILVNPYEGKKSVIQIRPSAAPTSPTNPHATQMEPRSLH